MFKNLDHVVRNDMVEESISTIQKIWASDPPYDIPGKYWPIKLTKSIIPELGIGYMSKTYQKPHPPIHISSMSPDGSTVAKAAKKGWTAVTANFTPESTVINHWRKYVEGCELVGRKPTGEDWIVARNILVAESDAEAEDWLLDPKGSSTYYFDYMWRVLLAADYTTVAKPDLNMKDEDVTLESIIRSAVIWGSPKTVAAKINSLRERSGPFGTLLLAMTDGSGPNLEREQVTMRRLAEQVRPLIK
jgi:alkanesulfonate monooxygenase SsuD/methylene tetrahydromethanopterin reductase-like flavin-dependent oxidoreductase (luciferase family)